MSSLVYCISASDDELLTVFEKHAGFTTKKKALQIWQVANQQIIDKLKRGMLPWLAGKGPGDTEAYGMETSLDLMVRLEMLPEGYAILDRADIVTSDDVIIHNPLKHPAGQIAFILGRMKGHRYMCREIQHSPIGRHLNDQAPTLVYCLFRVILYLPNFKFEALGLLPLLNGVKYYYRGQPGSTHRAIGRHKDSPRCSIPILEIRLIEDSGLADPDAAHNNGAP